MKIRRENIWECLTVHKCSCLHEEEMDLFLLWLIFSPKSPIFHFHLTILNIILENTQKERLTHKTFPDSYIWIVYCKFRQRAKFPVKWTWKCKNSRINPNDKHTCNHKNLSHKCTHNKSTFRAGISSSANQGLAQCPGVGQGWPRECG